MNVDQRVPVRLFGSISDGSRCRFGSISIPCEVARGFKFDTRMQIIHKIKPYPFCVLLRLRNRPRRRKNAASRTHFHYDAADRVTVIMRMRRSNAHTREHTQCFNYFPNRACEGQKR
jgi:hypothetical protein